MPSPDLKDPTIHGNVRIIIGVPEIWNVQFERLSALVVEDEDQGDINMGLGINRTGRDAIAVQLSLEVKSVKAVTARIDCRLSLQIMPANETNPEEINFEEELKQVAARVAPVVMYPYVRETLSGLSVKAGLDPFLLPVTNMGAIFDPDTIEIPSFQEAEDEVSIAEAAKE